MLDRVSSLGDANQIGREQLAEAVIAETEAPAAASPDRGSRRAAREALAYFLVNDVCSPATISPAFLTMCMEREERMDRGMG